MATNRLQSKMSISSDEDFADLYQAHLSAVFNYCVFRLGDPQLAEEITAQTFEKAWLHRSSYNPNLSSFVTWIFTIARNLISDTQRRQARMPTHLRLDDLLADCSPPLEEKILNDERLMELQMIIMNLDQEERELIAFKFGAGLTNRKIAGILHKSETSVGTALYRIMRKLRSGLEK